MTGSDGDGGSGAHAGRIQPARPGPPPRIIPAAPELSWLELFYDLAFVAAIVVISTTYSEIAGSEGIVWLVLVFSLIWCTWLSTTLMLAAGLATTTWTRGLLLVQMVFVLGVAITSNYIHEDHSTAVAPLFAAVLVTLALLYRSARRSRADLQTAYRGYGIRCLLAAVVFLSAPLVGWPGWYPILWVSGLVLFMAPVTSEERRLRFDADHLVHRFGEFTIVMLGEVFVKLGITATSTPLGRVDAFALPLSVAVVFGIWWLYFTDVPTMGMSVHHRRRLAWIHLHFPLHIGVIASAVALAHGLVPVDASEHHGAASIDSIQYVVVPVAVILASIGLLGRYGGGPDELARRRLWVFLGAAAVLVLTEVLLLGSDSYDLEASAVIVTVVLAATAWRIRRMGAPPATSAG